MEVIKQFIQTCPADKKFDILLSRYKVFDLFLGFLPLYNVLLLRQLKQLYLKNNKDDSLTEKNKSGSIIGNLLVLF